MSTPTLAEVQKHANETGLVPIKFKGVKINPGSPDGPENRAGEAGLGLRVGEIRGVSPEVAHRMIALDTAELVVVAKGKAAPAA